MGQPQVAGFPSVSSGSGIKSIQRGTVTATNNSSGTVTISAVDITKAVVYMNYSNGYGTNSGVPYINSTTPSIKINDSITLGWTGGVRFTAPSSEVNAVIEWQVVEYY